jgi:predicted lipoprotein with Yx(FWY)xxD motif
MAKSMSAGMVLTDSSGKPLYTYANDQVGATTSACTGGCASAWPPLTTTGTPTAGSGVTGTLAKLPSGQVTWNGHPLYTFASDSAGGSPTGDGVNSFHLALASGSSTSASTPTTGASSGGYGY